MSTASPVILVAHDFSPAARCALDWAVEEAGLRKAEVHIVHVIEYRLSDLFGDEPPLDEVRIAAVETAAEKRLAELHVPGIVHRHVAIGRPAQRVAELADRLKPTLLVVGTRGLSGLQGMVIGSVADYLVRHAACAVVCIKAPV